MLLYSPGLLAVGDIGGVWLRQLMLGLLVDEVAMRA